MVEEEGAVLVESAGEEEVGNDAEVCGELRREAMDDKLRTAEGVPTAGAAVAAAGGGVAAVTACGRGVLLVGVVCIYTSQRNRYRCHTLRGDTFGLSAVGCIADFGFLPRPFFFTTIPDTAEGNTGPCGPPVGVDAPGKISDGAPGEEGIASAAGDAGWIAVIAGERLPDDGFLSSLFNFFGLPGPRLSVG